MQLSRVVVGRQAIQDRARTVIGYELLFRSSETAGPDPTGDQMTADVVFGALNIGLNHVVHGRKIFCNADRGVLVGDVPITLPPGQTVIEVLETVAPDEEVLAGCERLAADGFQLALDDFVWFDGVEALLELATIVKFDVRLTQGDELVDLMQRCRPYGVRMLAEKVETPAEYAQLAALGFDFFQGYLLERPVLVSGRTIEPGRAARIRMAATLLGDDLDFEELNELLHADAGLAYQIIQMASLGRPGETRRAINTTQDALVMMGTRRIQNWMALLLARPDHPSSEDGFDKTLMRARACELLAGKISQAQASIGFAAGLLSCLDMLFGIPPEELRETLPIGAELAEAAWGDEGRLARIVRNAADYQLGVRDQDWDSGLTDDDLDDAFAKAFVWTMETSRSLDEDS